MSGASDIPFCTRKSGLTQPTNVDTKSLPKLLASLDPGNEIGITPAAVGCTRSFIYICNFHYARPGAGFGGGPTRTRLIIGFGKFDVKYSLYLHK